MTVFASGTTIITTVTETLEASESGGADAFSWFKSATYDIPNWFIFGLILAVVCYLVYRQVWQKKKRSIR
jgi:ribose/xylose/arabinose/galactoside ABC-type transport system permease subunit